ncbi:hypothetical protein O2W15_21990 [Modestobacter sp. VKM Ac-2979]|uniref:hypothetical protein n=1 Tax=unclassified Modestobacter TaxID=2643866 RepID=UPI0022AB7957|nr:MULTISPECIES: hypothetical protein [unclassified Modestobacter]MCZ2814110.1 hypothetical protein [Modestobacter sp. VKM Ac-2979]MCZ2844474.1 hypothetical protein [Modestobacter sp. VKM Ac-2980]
MSHRPVPGGDAGGPLVALCVGHRCAALRRLAGTADGVEQVAEAVRHTTGAVLVTADCLGRCDRAALAGLAHRSPGTGRPGPALWVSEVQTPERTAGLVAWVSAGGPGVAGTATELPECLRAAVAGIGPPLRPA